MPTLFVALCLFVAALDIFILLLPRILRSRGVLLWWRTKFGPALVFDSQDNEGTALRLLNVRGKYQSVAYVDENIRWELACMYHKYFAEIVDIIGLVGEGHNNGDFEKAKQNGSKLAEEEQNFETASVDPRPRAVVVGGGGYSFPKWLVAHCPRLHTTVVEVDPKITEIAREHFFLDELIKTFPHVAFDTVNADGWQWLRDSQQRFDLIVNDAFSGRKPLGPLGTTEGARLIHQRLREQGVYLANVIAPLEGKRSAHLHDVCQAFKKEFTYVWLIPEDEEEPQVLANNCLVASDHPWPIARRYRLS